MHNIARWALLAVTCGGLAALVNSGCGSSGGTAGTGGSGHGGAGGHGGGNVTSSGSSGSTSGTGGVASGTGGVTSGTGGVTSGTGGVTSGTGGVTTAASSSGSSGAPCVVANCQGHVYECGDCIDNDGDGLTDAEDPDCLGPCDNTESSYYGGIPGQAGPGCVVDCYFDQDSGSGNDDCHWNHKCDPHEVAPSYNPESWNGSACAYNPNANTPGTSASCDGMYNTQSATCLDYCGPLTPNGCDCFGCCELPAGGGKYVWLGSEDGNGNGSCDLQHVGDPTKCQPCLPVKACLNDCKPCELCIGKTTLPPECYPDGGTMSSSSGSSTSTSSGSTSTSSGSTSTSSSSSTSGIMGQCSAGVQPCGLPGEAPCAAGYYCITGCCQKLPN